jgi:hypothetical protein
MKRLAIAAFLVLSALGASGTHVAAAGLPRPTHAVNANDYSFYAETCTGATSGTCGEIYAYNDSSAQIGPPTGGYIYCGKYTSTQEEYGWLMIGPDTYGGYDGTGNVSGVAGVLSGNAIYSNLIGTGRSIYESGVTGSVTGSATGVVKYSPVYSSYYHGYPITGGAITITIRGLLEIFHYNTETYTTTSGSLTCTIAPNSHDSYVEIYG